jgi:hypothetical protein
VKGIKQANPLPPISLFPAHQTHIPDDLPSHEERGGNQEGQGTSHVYEGLQEKKETPQRHSTVCCPARPLRNDNASIGNSHQKGGDGARSAGPKKWGGREAMASVELRWRLGWCGLRGACRGSGFASLIPKVNSDS